MWETCQNCICLVWYLFLFIFDYISISPGPIQLCWNHYWTFRQRDKSSHDTDQAGWVLGGARICNSDKQPTTVLKPMTYKNRVKYMFNHLETFMVKSGNIQSQKKCVFHIFGKASKNVSIWRFDPLLYVYETQNCCSKLLGTWLVQTYFAQY